MFRKFRKNAKASLACCFGLNASEHFTSHHCSRSQKRIPNSSSERSISRSDCRNNLSDPTAIGRITKCSKSSNCSVCQELINRVCSPARPSRIQTMSDSSPANVLSDQAPSEDIFPPRFLPQTREKKNSSASIQEKLRGHIRSLPALRMPRNRIPGRNCFSEQRQERSRPLPFLKEREISSDADSFPTTFTTPFPLPPPPHPSVATSMDSQVALTVASSAIKNLPRSPLAFGYSEESQDIHTVVSDQDSLPSPPSSIGNSEESQDISAVIFKNNFILKVTKTANIEVGIEMLLSFSTCQVLILIVAVIVFVLLFSALL